MCKYVSCTLTVYKLYVLKFSKNGMAFALVMKYF